MHSPTARHRRAQARPCSGLLFALSLLAACLPARAQTSAPAAPDINSAPDAPAPSVASEQTVKLDPFEVAEDSDKSYGALNSNSITKFSAALDKLPISADVFDQAFMNDVGTTMGLEAMIETYSAGAGFSQSDPASSSSSNQPLDRNGNSYIQIRGLAAATMQRDGFIMAGTFLNPGSVGVGFSSSFDVQRVEVIEGPQALLYGAGGGGGVINTVSKQAMLGHPAFGVASYSVDQYGNKMGNLDYGMSTNNFAIRFDTIDQSVGGRRVNIGGPMEGYYGQVAFKLANTTVRIVAEDTNFDRINQQSLTLTAASTSNDARNGQTLHWLLATDQMGAAANGGPSGAGNILNGFVNWGNVDSFVGWQARENTVNRFDSLQIDSTWAPWLTTQVSLAYDDYFDDRVSNTLTLYAPNNTANPLGVWALGETGSTPMSDTTEPSRTKAIRASAVLVNDLFNKTAHSTTVFGADFIRADQDQITYEYFQADNSFNPIVTAGVTKNGGRTQILGSTQGLYWPVTSGPVKYPLWEVGMQNQVNFAGANWLRMVENPPNNALISPSDPQGVSSANGGHYLFQKIFQKGVYGANYTDWWGGKLSSILGFRYEYAGEFTYQEGSVPYLYSITHAADFSAGLNYRLNSWIRPYIEFSDSINPPLVQGQDPYGAQPVASRATGEEAGFKIQNPDGTVSGELALYHTNSKNEILQISSTLQADINPSGLNGVAYGSPGSTINANRTTQGIQLTLQASPVRNWRLRLSAATTNGTIGTTKTYAQVYNDQFYQDSAGDVTYSDGAIVYVPATFNSKGPLTVSSATAGAVPLTIAMMNNSAGNYYANPIAITGAISSSSNAGKVLLGGTDPNNANAGILTGKTGLPISAIQINPGFSPAGNIVVTKSGDATTGYPEFSMAFTNMYTFDTGWAKGLRVGGSEILGWDQRQFYYYPAGITINGTRTLFEAPQTARTDLILGYSHRFGRFVWSTQLNVQNIFNRYQILLLPSPIAGWTGPNNATFSQQPRFYIWSNTLSF